MNLIAIFLSLKSVNVTLKPFQRAVLLQPTHEDNNNINSSENNNRNKILLILARVHMMTLIIMMSFVLISCCSCCCYCYLQLLLLLVRCQRCNKMYIQTIIQQCKCVACNKRTNITTRTFTHMQAGIYIYTKNLLTSKQTFTNTRHHHIVNLQLLSCTGLANYSQALCLSLSNTLHLHTLPCQSVI